MQLSRFMQIALVLAAMIVAGSANAQVTVVPAGTIAGSQTWCDNETDMVLDGPVDVTGRLTILPGCIVRGQPRSADVPSAPPDPGAPGSLIIQPGAFLDARGTITSPIIFTTAAVDTDGGSNGAPDQVGGGNTNFRKWVPADGAAAFYDDTPLTNPLAAIDTTGRVNSSLWGGLVLLGDAPTNCGEGDIAPPDPDDPPGNPIIGRCNIEGSVVTNSYGGVEGHDSSGILTNVSVRHAGDTVSPGNELNGITLGGVGDGTVIRNVEVYLNEDDGIEVFGGTVNMSNLLLAYIGDDSLDIDQGYTGFAQNVLILATFFRDGSGSNWGGGGSGGSGGEWDGDDCGDVESCAQRIDINDLDGFTQDGVIAPQGHAAICNMTYMGNQVTGATNPANPASQNNCVQMRNGFSGVLANSICVSGGLVTVDSDANTNELYIVATTTDDFATGDAAQACTNGNARFPGTDNDCSETVADLENEDIYFDPEGTLSNSRGKLAGTKATPADPRPASPSDANVSGGVDTRLVGCGDGSATYRGATPASQPLFTDGWSAMDAGGIL